MFTTLTSITAFWLNTLGAMCLLALVMSTIHAIHGVFIPCSRRGDVFIGSILTVVAICKTFKSTLWVIIAAVVGFFWFLLYGTFVVIRDLFSTSNI